MAGKNEIDYAELARDMDELRGMVAIMVAGIMSDGFTEEQARSIVAGFFASLTPKREDGS